MTFGSEGKNMKPKTAEDIVQSWARGALLILMGLIAGCMAGFPAILIFWMGEWTGIQGGLPTLPAYIVFGILFPWCLGSLSRSAWTDKESGI